MSTEGLWENRDVDQGRKMPRLWRRVLLCLYLVFFSIVRSCLIGGNPSSPEHWAIFRFTLTWPHVNTPMLILYSLFPHSPSPHTQAYLPCMFSHALLPQLQPQPLSLLTFIEKLCRGAADIHDLIKCFSGICVSHRFCERLCGSVFLKVSAATAGTQFTRSR